MARFTVTTPEPGHNGRLGNVTFVDGVAVIDDETHPAELAYCQARGYGVVEADAETSDDAPAKKGRARKPAASKATGGKATEGAASTADAETSDDAPADAKPGDGEETTS